jgi:hypothetical protein
MRFLHSAILSIVLVALKSSGSGLAQHILGGPVAIMEPSMAEPMNIAPVVKHPWAVNGTVPFCDNNCIGLECHKARPCPGECWCDQAVRNSQRLLASH